MNENSIEPDENNFSKKLEEVRQTYCATLQVLLASIQADWNAFVARPADTEPLERIHFAVHKIAGSCTMFGLTSLFDLTAEIEALTGQVLDCDDGAGLDLHLPIDQAIQALSTAIGKLDEDAGPAPGDHARRERRRSLRRQDFRSAHPPARKILVVDDDEYIRHAIRALLGPYDVDILEAGSGREGFNLAHAERPDLIITDYNMPDGAGNYLLGRLSATDETKEIPVIMVTGVRVMGRTAYGLKREVLRYDNVTDYIEKPLVRESLLSSINGNCKLTARSETAGAC